MPPTRASVRKFNNNDDNDESDVENGGGQARASEGLHKLKREIDDLPFLFAFTLFTTINTSLVFVLSLQINSYLLKVVSDNDASMSMRQFVVIFLLINLVVLVNFTRDHFTNKKTSALRTRIAGSGARAPLLGGGGGGPAATPQMLKTAARVHRDEQALRRIETSVGFARHDTHIVHGGGGAAFA